MPNHEDTYPPTRYKAKLQHKGVLSWRPDVLMYLRLLWIVAIAYQESYVFKSAVKNCAYESWTSPALPIDQRLALVGDPQLVDENTYRRRGPALWATTFYTDLYMRRNYRLLHQYLTPDATIFTGDLFDGGRDWSDEKWSRELTRFRGVFPSQSDKLIVDSLPGNHDIGISDGIQLAVYTRFKKHFGETSRSFTMGKWEIVVFDAVALTSPDDKISADARSFLTGFAKSKTEKPKILITHVAPYRPSDAYCGPLREANTTIKIQRGYQYQNVLDPLTSDEIWKTIAPSVVFAGDDHDYCDYRHDNGIHVINVKSFSWAMGIHRPGFQLVSLSGTRYETHLCLLPNQLSLFLRYGVLLVLSFGVIVWVRVRGGKKSGSGKLLAIHKDDLGKHRDGGVASLKRLWIGMWQDMARVTWVVAIFYLYMIWW